MLHYPILRLPITGERPVLAQFSGHAVAVPIGFVRTQDLQWGETLRERSTSCLVVYPRRRVVAQRSFAPPLLSSSRLTDNAWRAKAELEREERRRRKGKRLSGDQRSKAVRAYWAMHVEALNWSGMSVTHYEQALDISAYSLRRWRDCSTPRTC